MRLQTIRPLTFCAAAAALGTVFAGPVLAAQPEPVSKIYVIEVPPAMDGAFREGVKSWVRCLEAHKAAFTLHAYNAESGDLSRYAFIENHPSWGDLDTHDPASKACGETFREDVLPHFTEGYAEFAQPTAKISDATGEYSDAAPIVWVDAYRFKPGHERDWLAYAAKFAAAAAKAHFNQPFEGYEVFGSGHDGEQALLVGPGKTWAEVGADPVPDPDKMMEQAYGKKTADALRDQAMAGIAQHWADAWSYDKELSYVPKK